MSWINILPEEILLKILSYLTYQDMGRVIVVNKRWRRLVEELLPSVRSLNIPMAKKYVWGKITKGIDGYRLFATFRGKPAYISENLWTMRNTNMGMGRLKNMFLYQMDGVWYSSFFIGFPDKQEGYLKSHHSSCTPTEILWAWYDLEDVFRI